MGDVEAGDAVQEERDVVQDVEDMEPFPATLKGMLDRNDIAHDHVVWWQSPSPIFTFGPRGPLRPTTFIGLCTLVALFVVCLLFTVWEVDFLLFGTESIAGMSLLSTHWAVATFAVLPAVWLAFGALLVLIVFVLDRLAQTQTHRGGLVRFYYAVTPSSLLVGYRSLLRLPWTKATTKSIVLPLRMLTLRFDVLGNGNGSCDIISEVPGTSASSFSGGLAGIMYVNDVDDLIYRVLWNVVDKYYVDTRRQGAAQLRSQPLFPAPQAHPWTRAVALVLMCSLVVISLVFIADVILLLVVQWLIALEVAPICAILLALLALYTRHLWRHRGVVQVDLQRLRARPGRPAAVPAIPLSTAAAAGGVEPAPSSDDETALMVPGK